MTRANVTTITLTHGETTPYVWCVCLGSTPKERFITKEEALDYIHLMETEIDTTPSTKQNT